MVKLSFTLLVCLTIVLFKKKIKITPNYIELKVKNENSIRVSNMFISMLTYFNEKNKSNSCIQSNTYNCIFKL